MQGFQTPNTQGKLMNIKSDNMLNIATSIISVKRCLFTLNVLMEK